MAKVHNPKQIVSTGLWGFRSGIVRFGGIKSCLRAFGLAHMQIETFLSYVPLLDKYFAPSFSLLVEKHDAARAPLVLPQCSAAARARLRAREVVGRRRGVPQARRRPLNVRPLQWGIVRKAIEWDRRRTVSDSNVRRSKRPEWDILCR